MSSINNNNNNSNSNSTGVVSAATNNPNFDLEGYISNYTGHTKIARLIFIAEHSANYRSEAARAAIQELKRSQNTTLYRDFVEKTASKISPEFKLDEGWIASIDSSAQKKLEKLEMELNSYRTNLIKESIRVTTTDDLCLSIFLV